MLGLHLSLCHVSVKIGLVIGQRNVQAQWFTHIKCFSSIGLAYCRLLWGSASLRDLTEGNLISIPEEMKPWPWHFFPPEIMSSHAAHLMTKAIFSSVTPVSGRRPSNIWSTVLTTNALVGHSSCVAGRIQAAWYNTSLLTFQAQHNVCCYGWLHAWWGSRWPEKVCSKIVKIFKGVTSEH